MASVEITKGKLLAAYKYTDEDDEYQRYRCKSFAAVCNYFTAKKRQTDYCISVSSSSALGEFLSNAHQFSIEHLIISESGTLDIRTSNYDFQYRYPSTIKKYRNSLFNYIFIPQEINRDLGNGLLRDKLKVIQKEIEHISCNYSKHFCSMIVSNPQKYFASYRNKRVRLCAGLFHISQEIWNRKWLVPGISIAQVFNCVIQLVVKSNSDR